MPYENQPSGLVFSLPEGHIPDGQSMTYPTTVNGGNLRVTPLDPGVERRTEPVNRLSIPNLQRRIREWAISKGWRDPNKLTRSFGDDMALLVSEVSEALEAFREHAEPNYVWYTYTVEVEHPTRGKVKFKDVTREQLFVLLDCETDDELDYLIEDMNLAAKPEGVGPELADVAIRLFDVCEQYGIPLEKEIDIKMNHNDTRAYKHGGKHL